MLRVPEVFGMPLVTDIVTQNRYLRRPSQDRRSFAPVLGRVLPAFGDSFLSRFLLGRRGPTSDRAAQGDSLQAYLYVFSKSELERILL